MSSTRHDVDALLARWPALGKDGRALPAEGDAGWEARADAIVAKARAAPRADAAALDALVAAPVLAGEPGEPGAQEASRSAARSLAAKPASGEITMSSPSDSGGSKSGPPPSMPKPRQSLREIAERASQSGRSGSMAPTSTPLPGRGSSPVLAPPPSRASTPDVKPAASTPLPSAPAVKRAAEGKSDDSGIVDLNIVKSTADARTVAAAEKAKPGEASLFEDDAAPASSKSAPAKAAGAAKSAAAKPSVAKAAPAPASKSSGSTVGIVIALVGVAAAFAIWQVRKGGAHETAHEQAGRPAATAAAAAPETKATAAPKAATTAAPAAVARAEGDHDLDPMNLPDEDDTAHPGHPRVRGPMPGAKEKDEKPAATAVAEAAKPAAGGPVGDLKDEMRKAVGADGKPVDAPGEPEPAAGDTRSKTLPERPSQGAVQAAIGQVLGSAKACVADADEPTRATVTFGSSGAVSNVTVTGWASANGKSGCVVSALKRAKVGGFTDASYSFPVTIRP